MLLANIFLSFLWNSTTTTPYHRRVGSTKHSKKKINNAFFLILTTYGNIYLFSFFWNK